MVLCAADTRHDAGQLIDPCLNGGYISARSSEFREWGLGRDGMEGAREESNGSVSRWAMAPFLPESGSRQNSQSSGSLAAGPADLDRFEQGR